MDHTSSKDSEPSPHDGARLSPSVKPVMLDASVGTAALEVTPPGKPSVLSRTQLFAAAEAVAELLVTETFRVSIASLTRLDVTSRIDGRASPARATAVAFMRQAPELLHTLLDAGTDVVFDVDVAILDDEGAMLAEAACTWRAGWQQRPAACA